MYFFFFIYRGYEIFKLVIVRVMKIYICEIVFLLISLSWGRWRGELRFKIFVKTYIVIIVFIGYY